MRRSVLRAASRTAAIVFAIVAFATTLGSFRVGAAASLTLTSQGFTPYRTCTLTATPSTMTSIIDATVKQASATTNFGTATTNSVSSASAANQRLYLKFDLTQCSPAIPSSATIRIATMRIYMSAIPAACRTIDIFPATAAWTEAAITWNNQPFGTTLNNPATGSRSDSFDVGTPAGCTNQAAGYVTGAEVTTDVAAFIAGTSTNHGWMLRDDVESSATARTSTFSAKNLGTLAQTPQLVITYVTS
jgi:hypothetical protein